MPLRGDEAFTTVHLTQFPLSEDGWFMVKNEPNPGMHTTYWLWSSIVGTDEFAMRYLPMLFGVLSVAVGLGLTQHLQRKWAITVAVGVLWAVHPLFIWHSQDIRQYSMLVALTPLNFYLLLRAIEHDKRRDWLLYILIQTFTVYLYYIELFWVVAQGLYVLSLKHQSLIKKFTVVWLVILTLLIPLFAQLYYIVFVKVYEPTAVPAEFSQLFSYFLPTLLFGDNTIPVFAGVVALIALTAGIWWYAQKRFLLLLWIYVPMALFYVLSTQASFFIPRYVIAVGPALIIGLVVGVFGFAKFISDSEGEQILLIESEKSPPYVMGRGFRGGVFLSVCYSNVINHLINRSQ